MRRFVPVLACLAAVAAAAGDARARPLPPAAAQSAARFRADFDAFIAGALARFPDVPSLTVAVTRSGGTIYARGFGLADPAARRRATPDTLYYIASSTKSFLGLAMAALAARGEIDLDWTLAALAPDVRFAAGIPAERITLRHLLSHTHGLLGGPLEFRLAYTGEHDPATLWRLLGGLRANERTPLGQFQYSNLGYNVAALLVERRLGRRWQDIVDREVLRPLGMRHSFTQGLEAARRRLAFAAPYTTMIARGVEPVYLVKQDDMMQSAGGMFASVNDLARFLRAQLAAERGRGTGTLSAAAIASTHRPIGAVQDPDPVLPRSGYGLGWYSGDRGGQLLYTSLGGFPGARSHLSFLPGHDIGVAALANDDGVGAALTDAVALYAYAWHADGPAAAAARGRELLGMLEAEFARRRTRIAAARAEQAARPWRLSLPITAYTGRYCNADYGTIVITDQGGRPHMAMGRLRAAATPFDRPETVRVEAIAGEGRLLRFALEGTSVTALDYDEERFARCR